jgi:PTS system nitrogen regulatory IIA component
LVSNGLFYQPSKMTISALLSPKKIFIDTEVTSKKKLLELIANIVADQTQLAESTIYSNLLNRERLGSTGLGQGFAVPHARMPDLEKTQACFFRLKQAVNFESPDNQPVDLVFTIIIPQEATEEHLLILSSLARIFSNAEVCEAIRQAPGKAEIEHIIQSAEQ